MSERISVAKASKMLGMNPQAVRILMQRGVLDIGFCYKDLSKGNSFRYVIIEEKLNKVIGK